MGRESWYQGRLAFKDQAAIDALRQYLVEEGYVGNEEGPIGESDITRI